MYNLANGGPGPGLLMFREVENVIIVVCGGDGTVGWVLETLGESLARYLENILECSFRQDSVCPAPACGGDPPGHG